MTLTLEIEFLAGVVFAARGPDTDVPDWPPQPDRVFSALVASWGAQGEQESEAAALRWLEGQPDPVIVASPAAPRTAPLSFVPPNDPQTGRSGNEEVMPRKRRRQPRRFPASRPQDPIVRYHWDSLAPAPEVFASLQRLAADIAYVGHSSSLTRCRFLQCRSGPQSNSQVPTRRIYRGRFEELRRDYDRFVHSGGKVGRPRPGDPVVEEHEPALVAPSSYFSPDWLILEYFDGPMPDIRAAALVAKEIRNTLLSGYERCGIGDRIPEEVSGHRPDGSPSSDPHLAIVPLAFAGSRYADGHVLGFALVPSRGSGILKDSDFLRALRAVAPFDGPSGKTDPHPDKGSGRNVLRLHSFELDLAPTWTASAASMNPRRYTRASWRWGTVTPMVLDRHLKKGDRQEEMERQIRQACRNIGLPEPKAVADKHPAVEGIPSAYPSGRAPAWMRWKLPASLASRQLTHAVIEFEEAVEGPVIPGAGRFVGLGLCLPLDEKETGR